MVTLFGMDRGELGRLLNELMVSRRFSQAELARRSGVSQTHVSRILSGENLPSTDVLDDLATALEVDATHLHRAYATSVGLRLEPEPITDHDLIALVAVWSQMPPEQRAAQRAAAEAVLASLRSDTSQRGTA